MTTKEIKDKLYFQDITQSQVAKSLGITRSHLSRVLSNKHTLTKPMRNKIENILAVPDKEKAIKELMWLSFKGGYSYPNEGEEFHFNAWYNVHMFSSEANPRIKKLINFILHGK